MNSARHWLLAARPKTLSIGLTPLLVGGASAWHDLGDLNWPIWLAALLAAIAIQIGTNLHNDAADFERGADTPDRLGPTRASAAGWLPVTIVRRSAHLSFALAFVLGSYLVWVGGWPIVVLGLASIAAGYAYTGGPHPIAYRALGELFVLAFFGLGAVGGTYYLQTLALNWHIILAGLAVGLPAAAVLLVNNYRDLESDRRAGKHTLTTFIGRPVSHQLYALMLILPLVLASIDIAAPQLRWLPWLVLPLAIWLIRRLGNTPISPALNGVLAATAGYQLLFGLLYSIALLA